MNNKLLKLNNKVLKLEQKLNKLKEESLSGLVNLINRNLIKQKVGLPIKIYIFFPKHLFQQLAMMLLEKGGIGETDWTISNKKKSLHISPQLYLKVFGDCIRIINNHNNNNNDNDNKKEDDDNDNNMAIVPENMRLIWTPSIKKKIYYKSIKKSVYNYSIETLSIKFNVISVRNDYIIGSYNKTVAVENYMKFGEDDGQLWICMCCNGLKDTKWINCTRYSQHWYHPNCLMKDHGYTQDRINTLINDVNAEFICPKCCE